MVKDLQKFKVHLPEDFDKSQLQQGCGETVCMIVNDLTNRELIARQYTFKQPRFVGEMTYRDQLEDFDEPALHGSTVFGLEASDIQNEHDRLRNEEAMRKSRDVTRTFKSKRELFRQINQEEGILGHDEDSLVLSDNLDAATVKSRNVFASNHLQIPYVEQETRSTTGVTGVTHGSATHRTLNKTYAIEKCTEDILHPNVGRQEWLLECARVEAQLSLPINARPETENLQDFFYRKEVVLEHLQKVNDFTMG